MIERIGNRFFGKERDKPKLKEQFHQIVFDGLALGDAGFLKIPPQVERGIVVTIANELVSLSESLDVPLPEIGLTKHWNDNTPERPGSYSIRDILASATVDEEFPSGIIRYSPFYLKSYITYKLQEARGAEAHVPLPLTALNGHEAFHLWQYKNKLDAVIRDVHILENDGLDQWSQTKTEIDAREFEKRWLERVFNPFA